LADVDGVDALPANPGASRNVRPAADGDAERPEVADDGVGDPVAGEVAAGEQLVAVREPRDPVRRRRRARRRGR